MLLDAFFRDTTLAVKSIPTFPTLEKECRKAETVAAVRLSDISDISDNKTSNVKQNRENKPLAPLSMPWTPDTYEGRPCCYLPHVPRRLGGLLPPDLKGFGVPSQCLPNGLAQFSLAGWRLELDGEEVRMVKVHPQARMEKGCRGYLRANYELVLASLRQWGGMACV